MAQPQHTDHAPVSMDTLVINPLEVTFLGNNLEVVVSVESVLVFVFGPAPVLERSSPNKEAQRRGDEECFQKPHAKRGRVSLPERRALPIAISALLNADMSPMQSYRPPWNEQVDDEPMMVEKNREIAVQDKRMVNRVDFV